MKYDHYRTDRLLEIQHLRMMTRIERIEFMGVHSDTVLLRRNRALEAEWELRVALQRMIEFGTTHCFAPSASEPLRIAMA